MPPARTKTAPTSRSERRDRDPQLTPPATNLARAGFVNEIREQTRRAEGIGGGCLTRARILPKWAQTPHLCTHFGRTTPKVVVRPHAQAPGHPRRRSEPARGPSRRAVRPQEQGEGVPRRAH